MTDRNSEDEKKTKLISPEELQKRKADLYAGSADVNTEAMPQGEIPTIAAAVNRRNYTPNGSKDSITREERFSGAHNIEEIVYIFAKGCGLGIGERLQIEATKACFGARWYILGPDTKYGLCVTEDYQIMSAGRRLTARPINGDTKYFEKLGQFAAEKIRINLETGKPFKPREEDKMFVDVRLFSPSNYQKQTDTNQGQEGTIDEGRRKTPSVRLESGSVRAKFE